MFALLLALSLLASLLVSAVTVLLFWWPLRAILAGRVSENTALAWSRLLAFAVCVIGVSFGVRPWELEQFSQGTEAPSFNLLTMETYKSLIFTAQANIVVLLFIFFGIGIIAAMKRRDTSSGTPPQKP